MTKRELGTVYTIERIPRSAQARNTVGYQSTTFEVIADDEREAVAKAKADSYWPPHHFAWRVASSRVLVIEGPIQ